jgi:hypothetical protein
LLTCSAASFNAASDVTAKIRPDYFVILAER